jgi:hypothetical protein
VSGLAASSDLLLGIYSWGADFNLTTVTEAGSLVNDPPPQTGFPGQCVGLWGGHLPLSGTSAAGQGATYPGSINWAAASIAISG